LVRLVRLPGLPGADRAGQGRRRVGPARGGLLPGRRHRRCARRPAGCGGRGEEGAAMIDLGFPPPLLMILGAFLVPALPAAGRRALAILLPAVVLALVWLLPPGASLQLGFLGL